MKQFKKNELLLLACSLCLLVVVVGCDTTSAQISSSSSAASAPKEKEKKFVLGDMIDKNFVPPATLAELEKDIEWIDAPVIDSMKILRDKQATQKTIATEAEGLAAKNNSPENNEKILFALGRVSLNNEAIDYDATIQKHAPSDAKSTNPLLMSSVTDFELADFCGFSLFGFDGDFNAFASPDSVVSWQISKDRTVDKVVLRDDLTWSDGKPITAYDIEFTYRAIMSHKVPCSAVRSGTEELLNVKAYDARTVVFFHKKSLVTNKWNVNFPIIPKHIYEKTISQDPTLGDSEEHVKLELAPVTGGAYEITKLVTGVKIVLKRRKSYYMHKGKQVRDKPHFKKIVFNIVGDTSVALLKLKKGDLEEMVLKPAHWHSTETQNESFYKKNTKAYGIEWVCFSFFWNNKVLFFKDVNVRRAMSYAFAHDEMIKTHRYGMDEKATGIFHPASKWAIKPALPAYSQDLDKAAKLLTKAGWIDHDGDGYLDKEIKDRDGKHLRYLKFRFTMAVPNKQSAISICSLMKENLDRLGIQCDIKPTEFTVLTENLRNHKFQAALGGWGTGTDPDTSENLWTTKAITEGRNYVNYSNPYVDYLYKKGKTEFNEQKRIKIYQEIQRVLYRDQPYTWLYYRNALYGFNKKLRGYNFSPRGPYNYGPGFGSIYRKKTTKAIPAVQ